MRALPVLTFKWYLRWPLLIGAILITGGWVYERSHTVAITDARIASNVIVISSYRPGLLTRFVVESGNQVAAGDLLVQIDDRAERLELHDIDLQIAVQKAEINRSQKQLMMLREELDSQMAIENARLESVQSSAHKADSALQLSLSNFRRSDTLYAKQLLSRRQWEEDRLKYHQSLETQAQAKSEFKLQAAQVRKARVQLSSAELLEQQIAIMEKSAESLNVKRQKLILEIEDRQIRSPIQAVIDKTFSHVGEYVSQGRRLLMLHDPNHVWVDANLKETELRHIRLGMTASVVVDAYPDKLFKATITHIDHATTSEFALLPNPNPSSNFTKVTQRIRVNLAVEQEESLLKPGMMVEVSIDTRSR